MHALRPSIMLGTRTTNEDDDHHHDRDNKNSDHDDGDACFGGNHI